MTPAAPPSGAPPPRVAGVVLAAGAATRMGGRPKLLLPLGGHPVVRHVVDTATRAGLSPLIVVAGHRADDVRDALSGSPAELEVNPAFSEGLSTSLALGLSAVAGRAPAAIILLGDEPGVSEASIRAVLEEWRRTDVRAVRVRYRDRPGHPVLVDEAAFDRVTGLTGDAGLRDLFASADAAFREVQIDADAPIDIDTEEAYREALARLRR